MKWLENIKGLFRQSDESAAIPGPSSKYEAGQTRSRKRSSIPGRYPTEQRKELPGSTRRNIVQRSRHLEQNSGLLAESDLTMVNLAIGDGIRAQANTLNKEWNAAAEKIFNGWARRPEITGRFTLAECQNMICNAIDDDGEIFALKVRDRFGNPRIQLLETHRFSSVTDVKKRLYDGIEYSPNGAPRWYHLLKPDQFDNTSAFQDPTKTKRIRANSVIHIFEPKRISASRGVPPGQAGLLNLQDSMETQGLMTSKVKDHAGKSLILKSNRPDALQDGSFGMDDEDVETMRTDEKEIAEALDAQIQRIDDNEELAPLNSESPHANFANHMEALERSGLSARLPWELIRNAKDVRGAGVRLFVSKIQRRVRYRQSVIETRAMNPFWFSVIGDSIDSGELPPMEGWHRPKWTRTRSLTVDAGRDSAANLAEVTTGMKLISEDIAERGDMDFQEWLAKRASEARQILTAAGIPESEPIPVEMLYNPGGGALNPNQQVPAE